MKKIFTLLFACTLLYSCSGDGNTEINESMAVDFETQNNEGVYDNSKLGIYKGVFTTLDGQSRAVIQIELDGKNEPTAEFNFPDSNKASLSSGNQVSKSASTDKISFSDTNFSFDFSVEEGGLNPTVSNVTYKGQKGDVIILKETSKAPVSSKTGTYSCLVCNNHPELGKPGAIQTFNTVLQNSSDGTSEITLQATLNRRVFGGQLTQSGCSSARGLTQCNLNGTLQAGSGPVFVTGKHVFDNANSPSSSDCSDLSGNFLYPTGTWGEVTMSFKTDAPGNCF